MPVKDVSYEEAYAMQEHKLGMVSVAQFTDGWGYKIYNNDQWLTEDIDHSFADWAKKNAKTFMSVVYPTIEDKEREQKNNFTEPWSIQQMKKAGHPNAYNANGVPDGKCEQDIIDAFKHTAIEKAPSSGSISLTPSGALQIKSVTVTAPDGKVIASNVADLSKVKAFDQKGAYKVAYTFTGTGSVTGDLTIDGKSDTKTDTLNAVVKPAEPAKRIEKIPYNTKTVDDPTLPFGERKVVQKGVEGEKEITGGTTTSSRKSVDLLAIIDTSPSMVENYGRALESAENLVKSMTDNDTITFAHYQTNGLDSYNTGNGKADGPKANSKPMLLGAMTEPMTKAQAIKYLEDAKTFKVGNTGVYIDDFLASQEKLGYKFQKEDGKGFQDVYMAHHKADSTVSVIQFTDGWMDKETIDSDFAAWATKNAKTFMTVSYKNNGSANGGPTEFSINNMKAAGHTNIYDERQTPIDDAKIAKQFEETATEKQVPRKETVIKLPVDEIVHVGTKKVTRHVDKATGKEIAPMVKGLTNKQSILGYRFVETKTDANGDRRHVYEQVSTHFVDETGKEISSTVKGIAAKKDIPNYTYVRQTSADNGDVIHVYHAMMTHFVDELTGDVLAKPETGNQPKKDIAGFTYHTSKIDGEGDMRHFYNGVVTRFVDRIAGAEIAHFEPGRALKKDIKGYRFFGTTVNDNGHTRHAYEMIVTRFVDKTGKELKKLEKGHAQEAKIDGYRLVSKELKDNGYSKKDEDKDLIYTYEQVSTQFVDESGKALRESEVGLKDAKAINGYHVVETKVAENGDRVHVYAKDVVEQPKSESKVETPKVETKVDTPKAETFKGEAPKVETPKVETKVEPKVEPKVESKHNYKADLKDDVAVESSVRKCT